MFIGTYDYDGLIDAYVNQRQSSGTTAEGRMSFKQDTLYSYSSKLVQRIAPDTYIFDQDIKSYSVTTAKHSARIWNHLPKSAIVFITSIDATPQANIARYIDHIHYLIGKHNRARNTKWQWGKQIHKCYFELVAYADFCRIDKRTKAYKSIHQTWVDMFANKVL